MEKQELINVLIELRNDRISLGKDPSEVEIRSLMDKYDMLFLGKEINKISTIELCHSLKKADKEIDIQTLIEMVPTACQCLNMKYEPLINVIDSGKPNPPIADYSIELF